MKALRIQVHGYIWQQDIGQITLQISRDWWQAFKEQFFPAWALRRWPVRYVTTTYDISLWYPDLHTKIAVPNHEHRMHVQIFEPTEGCIEK